MPDQLGRINAQLQEMKLRRMLKLARGGANVVPFAPKADAPHRSRSPFGVFLTDRHGSVIFTCETYQTIVGCSLAETLGHGWTRCLERGYRREHHQAWLQAVKRGQPFDACTRIRHCGTGESFRAFVRAMPLQSEAGEVVGYSGIVARKESSLVNATLKSLPILTWLLTLALTAACSRPPQQSSGRSPLDAPGWLACRQYAKVQQDVQAGVLTDAELRECVRAVYEQARVTPGSSVAVASQHLLADLTAGVNGHALTPSVTEMYRACHDWQHRNPE